MNQTEKDLMDEWCKIDKAPTVCVVAMSQLLPRVVKALEHACSERDLAKGEIIEWRQALKMTAERKHNLDVQVNDLLSRVCTLSAELGRRDMQLEMMSKKACECLVLLNEAKGQRDEALARVGVVSEMACERLILLNEAKGQLGERNESRQNNTTCLKQGV